MPELSNEEYERIFDPMDEVADRWDITLEEAELFLENCGYFEAIGGGKVPSDTNSGPKDIEQ